MKHLVITQNEVHGKKGIVLNIDGDIIHVELDDSIYPTQPKEEPSRLSQRFDEYILFDYSITYENLTNVVLSMVGDATPGNKIQAIKLVRELFRPIGLREAKEFVDGILAHRDELPF